MESQRNGTILDTFERAHGAELQALRSELHRNPELGLHESYTTALLRGRLAGLGLEPVELGLETGAAFLLRGGHAGKTAALRADIDALPVQEATGAADASRIPGVMHACGHDVHTAALYGAAVYLSERREELAGNVVFLFQPAEEPVAGARAVIAAGLFDRIPIDAVFGLHVWPQLPSGTVGIRPGPFYAAKDSFQLIIQGRGGHGSAPENARDPIPAGAAAVSGIQSILGRNLSAREAAVVSVCALNAGSSDNVIPDTCSLLGSIRTFSDDARRLILRRLEEIGRGTAEAYGCTAEFVLLPGVPVLTNDPALCRTARKAAEALFGPNGCVESDPVTVSEDFALYGEKAPLCYCLFGVGGTEAAKNPLHSAKFYPAGDTIAPAALLLAGMAREFLNGI